MQTQDLKKNFTIPHYKVFLAMLFLFCFQANLTEAQNKTLLFVDDFDEVTDLYFDLNTGGTFNYGNNKWVINNSYDGLGIYANTPSQTLTSGSIGQIGTPGGKYMHIRDFTTSPLNATYKPKNNSDRWAIMNTGVCTYGFTNVTMTFWWCTKGTDYAFGEVYYSVDGGVTWKLTSNIDGLSKYNNMDVWKYSEINLQEFTNQSDLSFAFRWMNSNIDTSGELSFSVDDVMIVGEYDISQPTADIFAIEMDPTPICQEDVNNQTITFTLSFSDTMCPGNYLVELSDSNCNFDNPIGLVNLNADFVYPGFTYSVPINLLVPTIIPVGSCYCFRVNRTSPPYLTGTPSSNCFEIIDCPESIEIADTPAVLKDQFCEYMTICKNSVIDVPFYSYGAYNPGNEYYLELSDSSGSFDSAKVIGGPSANTQTYDPAIYPPPVSPGSQSGKIPSDVPPGCNYYIRVNSTNPSVRGASWGPFCIKECDIETNNTNDITVCITNEDSICISVPVDINIWDSTIFYNDSNEFLVQILDSKTMEVVNQGVLGKMIDTISGNLLLCIPKFYDYLALPMKLKMYYMRIISTNSSDSTDQCGTLIRLTVTGITGAPLTIVANPDSGICASQDQVCFTILPLGLPETSQYKIVFSSGGSFTWDPQNPDHPAFQPSQTICFFANSFPTGTIEVIVQEQNGANCVGPFSLPDTFQITATPDISFDGDFKVCVGDTVTYSANFAPAVYYDWSQKGGTILERSNNQITIHWNSTGFGFYVGLYALGYCGEDFRTKSVTVIPKTEIETSPDTSICLGDSVSVSAKNITTSYDNAYYWTFYGNTVAITNTVKWDGADSVSLITVTPDTTTTYLIEINNSPPEGCSDFDSVKVIVSKVYPASDTLDMCAGDTIKLDVQLEGESSFYWSPSKGLSDTTIKNPLAYPEDTITYYMSVAFTNGCIDTQYIKVEVTPTAFDISPDDTIAPGQHTTVTAEGGTTYLWSPSNSLDFNSIANPVATPETTTTYKVTITDANNCKREKLVTIYVISPNLVIPSAFSPNGDGQNDSFYPVYLAIEELYEYKIYNRWGELIFETNVLNQGWDGIYKDVPQEIGTYIYYVKAKALTGETITLKGNVSLIR